ncbi:retrovirus-related pol polyprotein from transposon TNT 1-94 [Tanacetum coccineum]
MKCVTMDSVKPKALSPGMYAIDVEPIPPCNKKNREVHLDYLKHLKESVETLREIVEEARVEKPLDSSLASTCLYTKQLNCSTEASGSQPRSNTKNNRILPAKSVYKKKVEDHPRNNKSNLKQTNCVDSSISYKCTVINSNSDSLCKTCNQCLIFAKHDLCVVKYLNSVNATPNVKKVLSKLKQVWKATGKMFNNVGYQWKPTRKKFTLGEKCPLNRLTKSKVVPLQKPEHASSSINVIIEKLSNTSQKPLTRYKRRNTQDKAISSSIPTTAETQITDAYVKCTAISTNQQDPKNWLLKTYDRESLMAYEFRKKVHRDNLEVAFKFFLCYIRNEDGVELLKGSWGSNMYTIFVEDMMKSSLICFLSKASKNKSWLWHRRLNHLNFGTINDLARKDLVRGLPRLKFEKDHLCSACQLGKSKKYTHKPKSENTIMEVLHTLHMDLCGPMRAQSINGRILLGHRR